MEINTMKRILVALSACLILLSCSQSPEKKDIALVNDFYEHVLGNKPMTDKYLQKTLTTDVLDSIWETEYEDTYTPSGYSVPACRTALPASLPWNRSSRWVTAGTV